MAAPLMRNAVKRPGSSSRALPALLRRCRLAVCISSSISSSSSSAGADVKPATHHHLAPEPAPPEVLLQLPRSSTHVRLARPAFDATSLRWVGGRGEKSPDPNKAKLGKTLRILQERLPTLLQSPLPQEILAPNIALQLFPTTHPHLPTVSGRVAYNAALWTSPIAWNRVPIIGNVRLEILAERMTSEPLTFLPRRPGAIPEQLVVRWTLWGGRGAGVEPNKAFTGLFTFDFDAQGRILTHTIEQAQEGGDWERGVGAKFVGLTDWLLGGMKDPDDTPIPVFENLKKRREN
ncbi:mitochondrial protein [Hirsutella rhossiliensis]|uniref:Mitochondrial protein n=1 Tax=Hirsutella rhossiliensis TaxID=111463 RepID=A0A9P8MUZ5_9HYPO|nr:mitochondrial protein [Hirsutella rhossiliensis]KAH0960731.1 mitochondrial protein [Hirsutella rhossiliensis]